jgi:hypothetical protein
VPASYNVHPEFGFLCPTPRFHRRVRLVLAGLVVGWCLFGGGDLLFGYGRARALAKASDAEVATRPCWCSGRARRSRPGSNRYGPSPGAGGKRAKKTKTASRRVPRRDPNWYGTPSWREVETPNFW